MSYMSINNPLNVTRDIHQVDQSAPAPVKKNPGQEGGVVNYKVGGSGVAAEDIRTTSGEVTVNADALKKLFDMFELVFKAMRDMLSGKKVMPQMPPDAGKQAKVAPDASNPAMIPGTGPKVAPNASKPAKVTPDASNPAMIPGTGPKVAPNASKPAKVTPDAIIPAQIPGTGPNVLLDAAKPAKVTPDAATSTVIPGTGPKVTVQPKVPGIHLKVSNDANMQVKVDVNVMNCHCPSHDMKPDAPVLLRVSGNDPKVTPDARLKPALKPDATVQPKVAGSDSQVDSQPRIVSNPTPATVLPDTKVLPDTPSPKPDLTSPPPADYWSSSTSNGRSGTRYDNIWSFDGRTKSNH